MGRRVLLCVRGGELEKERACNNNDARSYVAANNQPNWCTPLFSRRRRISVDSLLTLFVMH